MWAILVCYRYLQFRQEITQPCIIYAAGCSSSDTLPYEILGSGLVELSVTTNPLCSNQDPISISTIPSGVDGIFEGTGVSSSGQFDPALANDSVEIHFIYGPEDCIDTAQIIEGEPIQFDEGAPYCLVDTVFSLSASPEGGDWSGAVDEAGRFNPSLLGPGRFSAIYSTVDSVCPEEDTLFFEVIQPPAADLPTGSVYFLGDDNYDIDIFPTDLDGQFAGPGIIDSREGIFSPSNAGTGIHQIIFEAAINGCNVSIDSTLEVFA